MVRRVRWVLVCVLVTAGGATAALRPTVSPMRPGMETRLVTQAPARASAEDVETVTVPSESMEPTLPIGSTIELDYDAFDGGPPSLGDIVVFNPPRSAEHM